MVNVWKILRSMTLGNRPSGRSYGEPYVNFAENQFGVINNAGAAQDLLGVPIFSTTMNYSSGQPVNHGGILYIAQVAVSAGAWNATQWSAIAALANIPAPVPPVASGTVMLFYMAAAPTGWTQVTTHNDKLLRVVSGTGAGSGGSNSFSSVNAQTATQNHTLAATEIPQINSYTGSVNVITYPGGNSANAVPTNANGFGNAPVPGTSGSYTAVINAAGNCSYTGSMSALNSFTPVSNNTAGYAHSHPIIMGIQYVDLIIASKN